MKPVILATAVAFCIAASAAQAADNGTGAGLFGTAPVPERTMAELRGGALQLQESTMTATMTDNICNSCAGASSTISDGAFGQARGIITVFQNSGSGALLQNSTIVSVEIH